MLDKRFLRYIKEHKDATKILLVLVVGMIFIFVGVKGSDTEGNKVGTVSLEDQLADICSSVDGVGACRVLIYYVENGTRYSSEKRVASVVVVCEGADSIEIRKELTDMLASFFGIGANRIRIEKMAK
jgi:type III secretory pathway lipoprotein EscJ